jgi:hypothetical protein
VTEDKQPPQLPEGFQFSQSSLQDFVDCPRRFQLRYVLMQPWPGLITESPLDFEQHWRRGRDLHRLAHQHALGIDAETLEGTISDKTLKSWWQTFLHQPPSDLPQAAQSPEVTLTAPLAGYRLLAKVDLLAAEPGQRLVVVDWKTVHRPLPRTVLAQRLQTRVYRYLAVEAGAAFNSGQQPQPEQVEMLYWFAQREGTTERFPYDTHQHAADREYLEDLIKEITAQTDATWQLTQQQRHCRFCNYRSLCERGVTAGRFQDLDDDLELPEPEIDLEQIAEVEF